MPRIGFKESRTKGIEKYGQDEVKDLAELKSKLKAKYVDSVSLIYTTPPEDRGYHRTNVPVTDLRQEDFDWLTEDHPYDIRYVEL